MTEKELHDILRAIEKDKTYGKDIVNTYIDFGLSMAQHIIQKYFNEQQEEENNGTHK